MSFGCVGFTPCHLLSQTNRWHSPPAGSRGGTCIPAKPFLCTSSTSDSGSEGLSHGKRRKYFGMACAEFVQQPPCWSRDKVRWSSTFPHRGSWRVSEEVWQCVDRPFSSIWLIRCFWGRGGLGGWNDFLVFCLATHTVENISVVAFTWLRSSALFGVLH